MHLQEIEGLMIIFLKNIAWVSEEQDIPQEGVNPQTSSKIPR